MSRWVTFFSNANTSKNISNPRIFANTARLWGRAGPVIHCQIMDRRPTQPVTVQPPAPSVRPGRLGSNFTGRLPGLAWILKIVLFALCLRCLASSSRFRGRKLLGCQRPAAALGSRLSPTSCVRSRVSYIYRYFDIIPLGCVCHPQCLYHDYLLSTPRENIIA